MQRTHSEHIIVLDEYGRSVGEDALLTDLRSEYAPPDFLESASQCRAPRPIQGGTALDALE